MLIAVQDIKRDHKTEKFSETPGCYLPGCPSIPIPPRGDGRALRSVTGAAKGEERSGMKTYPWKARSFPGRVCAAFVALGGHDGPVTLHRVGDWACEIRKRFPGQCPARLLAEWARERGRLLSSRGEH